MNFALGIVAVAVGGAAGAILRYVAELVAIAKWGPEWPYGTFAVNMAGSFILGTITGLTMLGDVPHMVTLLVGTGFCGALTTFSSFALQAVALTRDAADDRARVGLVSLHSLSYVCLSLGGGLLLAAVVPSVILAVR